MDWLKTLLEWLERVLPGLLAAFGIGYKVGKTGKEEIESNLAKVELELKMKENHEKVDKDLSDMSDADIVNKIAGPK